MEPERLVLYLTTVLLLMSTPGPSQLLMLGNSIKHGFPRSAATAVGDLTANALQMLAAGLGVAAVLQTAPDALQIIKWTGVVYLCWMAVKMFRDSRIITQNPEKPTQTAPVHHLWLQGFMTSAVNPKAIVFFAALFPQFIDGQLPYWPQHIILSVCYLLLDGLFLCLYGILASWLARRLASSMKPLLDRASAGGILFAALLLAFKA